MVRVCLDCYATSFPITLGIIGHGSSNHHSLRLNDTLKDIGMKEEFFGIVSYAKEAHSLGSLSISEGAHSIAFLPYIIDLTILNAMPISFGSYRFQFLLR